MPWLTKTLSNSLFILGSSLRVMELVFTPSATIRKRAPFSCEREKAVCNLQFVI